jgi:hypothetical protein
MREREKGRNEKGKRRDEREEKKRNIRQEINKIKKKEIKMISYEILGYTSSIFAVLSIRCASNQLASLYFDKLQIL